MSSPSTVPSGPSGTADSGPTARMAASIPASAGGTICAPAPIAPPSEAPR